MLSSALSVRILNFKDSDWNLSESILCPKTMIQTKIVFTSPSLIQCIMSDEKLEAGGQRG